MLKLDISKGMDNRQRAEALPEGYIRNAVNVQYDPTGKIRRAAGATQVYAGTDIHSFWEGYFIEGSDLKYLDANDIVSTLLSGIGPEPVGFTRTASHVYCGNTVAGYVINPSLTVKPLGVPWPEQQPVLTARTSGGMFAGEYQVVITYLTSNGEESGCGVASTITVTDGGGITFTVPTVPANIDRIAVYVSSVNGDELFLYDEYDATTTTVSIDNNISAVRLATQFYYPPIPSDILQNHYGRLYWADGSILRYTEAQRYGFTKANYFAPFEEAITLISAVPGALYVCADKTYKIGNTDKEGFMQRTEVLPYGAVKGTLHFDERTETAFWQSHKGIVAANAEGIQELVAEHIAMPKYDKGALTITERSGVRQIVAVSQGGSASDLMDAQFKTEETTRTGSAL